MMTSDFAKLPDCDLRSIAAALRSGRLAAPYTALALQRIVSAHVAEATAEQLRRLHEQGFSPAQINAVVDLLLHDRSQRPAAEDLIQLVTTGPEAGGTANRDTAVVVRELFATAEESVLVAGYAVYQGHRVFRALADRMQARPTLDVRMYLDVRRPPGDTSSVAEVVMRFADRFRQYDWPKDRPLPAVYYFPLSLEDSPEKRAALHAKCVVVDSEAVFVSSANFTEAAQERNIEVGLLIRSAPLAQRIVQQFNSLAAEGLLRPVFHGPAERLHDPVP